MKEYFPKDKLFEKLASVEHERWADWQRYCHSQIIKAIPEGEIPLELNTLINRWERQINTSYYHLTEEEKDSDREQVMRYWYLIK